LLWLYKACWLTPKRKQKFYISQLSKTKYRVKEIPYKFLYHRDADILDRADREGDPVCLYKN
jgi:hypothetical protein